MTEQSDSTSETNSCSLKACSGKINYCFIAKLLVALPAIPLLGVFAASFYEDPAWKFAAASYAGAFAVWMAGLIDSVPALSRKFKPRLCSKTAE